MPKGRKRRQNENYKFLGNCPICDRKFGDADVTPIEEEKSINTVYAECRKCESSIVLGVIKNVPGLITTVGMLTDMNFEDIGRMANMPSLTANDVLEVHKYLEKS